MVKKCGRCSYDNTDESKYSSRCGTLLFAAPLTIPTALATKPLPTALATKPISSIITSIGMCFYHHNLPAVHICGRCGRQICRHCALSRTGLMLCVECSDKFFHPWVPVGSANCFIHHPNKNQDSSALEKSSPNMGKVRLVFLMLGVLSVVYPFGASIPSRCRAIFRDLWLSPLGTVEH